MARAAHRVIITARSPLSYSQRKPGGIFQPSEPFVPGSALRGAVAARLLEGVHRSHTADGHAGAVAGCDFCDGFLGPDAAVFTNARPVRDPAETPRLAPTTALSCKSHPGFRRAAGAGHDAEPHGVFDTVIDRLCWEQLEPAGLLYAPGCPVCQRRVTGFGGGYVRTDAGAHHARGVSQRLLTRVAINRRRGVAEEGLLYSPWVIEEVDRAALEDAAAAADGAGAASAPATTFVGAVYGADDDILDALRALRTVGGGGSRGLNQVSIAVEDATTDTGPDVAQRIDAFNARVAERWSVYQALGGNGQPRAGIYFTVDLTAPAVLRRPDGRPGMVLDEALLERATDGALSAADVTLVRSYATHDHAGGWSSAWKLPKPVDVCAAAGSVYVFHAPDGLTDAKHEALAALQRRGVGGRTAEGYGQVRVCDPFHLVLRDGPA